MQQQGVKITILQIVQTEDEISVSIIREGHSISIFPQFLTKMSTT